MNSVLDCVVTLVKDGDYPVDVSDLPDWMVVGESILIRPYNSSGVIAYIGGTHFSSGIWAGIQLDAPTGMYTELLPNLSQNILTISIEQKY